ncbi:unnamed protein product [Diamesa serratosioi]
MIKECFVVLMVIEVSLASISYQLYSKNNPKNGQPLIYKNPDSVDKSNYNGSKKTKLIIHGYGQNGRSDMNRELKNAFLKHDDYNVIVADWSSSAGISYDTARVNVEPLGKSVAKFVDWMGLDEGRLHVIGYDLGAHIAGFAGKNTINGRIDKITGIIGLDPAGPLFDINNPATRLAITDADYVECHHTNGGLIGAGIGAPIGHADFFPNGGSSQPGCLTNTCSHLRAVTYYVESINNNGFWAFSCANANDAGRGRCSGFPYAFMGGEPSNRGNRGIYWLATNRRSPFGQGTLI